MSKSFRSHKKEMLTLVVATCLIATSIAAGSVYPLTAQTPVPAQKGKAVSQMIDDLKSSGAQFPAVDLLHAEQAFPLASFVSSDTLRQGVALNYDKSAASILSSSDDQTMTLKLPDPQGTVEAVELELARVNIFAEGFTAVTSNGTTLDHPDGVHLRGAVKGVPGSLAAVSVFKNEIAGFYSLPDRGNFVLGRLTGPNPNNVHVLYADGDLKDDGRWVCGTRDGNTAVPLQDLKGLGMASAGGCVRVYVEADYDVYLFRDSNEGSAYSYITALFNQSATLFANDAIRILLSQAFIWVTNDDPYNATNAAGLLQQFKDKRDEVDGDIAHLVVLHGSEGLADGIDTLCNADPDRRKCVSYVPGDDLAPVPTYSRTVKVFTHEMGHLMGSRHTQACVWNGNCTAIDGCAAPETDQCSCVRPAIPANGGTIMSYCDQRDSGSFINFSLGFGPQPGDLIRNRISAATCISACGTGCIYLVSPTSISIQANGGSRSVSVTTMNGCNWSAVSNSSFITIAYGSSGNGDGSVGLSVAPNSATSSRTGTVTVAGKTVTVSQAANTSGELIINGGFESGTSPWLLIGAAYRSTGAFPHSGIAYSIIVDGNNETGSEFQSINIPSGAARSLTFWLNVTSEEVSSYPFDNIYVEVLYRDGGLQLRKTLATFSNMNKGTAGAYVKRGPYSLAEFAGQKVDIQLRAVNDFSLPTYFRVDDVSVR
ncbi:MAG TPA: M12 family metallo-peptidase [Blastocatellia bacterium]|nr:M12 family metallo-peptidase [Blastocatellia bacterium]